MDKNLAHYDGDHLVLRPQNVDPAELLDAVAQVRRRFYSWWSIARRWGRMLRAYLGGGKLRARILPALLLSFILWQLSIFQRKHGRERVEPLLAEARRKLDKGSFLPKVPGGVSGSWLQNISHSLRA